LHEAQRLPLDKYPNLKRWMTEGMEQLGSWKKTQGAVESTLLPHKAANGASGGATDQPDVRTTINYTRAVEGLTELYFYESDKAKNIHEPGAPVEIRVHDGRPHASSFSLDKQGFSLHSFTSSYSDWESEDAVRSDFYPDVVSFLKKTTGAHRVLVFDHTIRSEKNAQKALTDEKNTSQRSPVMLVHCDYTSESAPLRLSQLLPSEPDLAKKPYAFINVWKPINRVVEERPLAMCDVTSTQPDDFFKLFLRYRDRTGENYVMRHREGHKWWWFPRMTPQEVILLKTFDSEADGRARFVGHSAFVDPNSKEGAPMRESVEIRTICFFE
jgi:hypothetical protein